MAGGQSVSKRAGRRGAIAALASALAFGPVPVLAQRSSPDALKAEVVYRLMMFVAWPAERETPERGLQICTLGDGSVDNALQGLSGRPIRQLTVVARRLPRPEQFAGCHLLYVAGPQPALRAALADAPVLLVSDAAGMLDQGAMINLQVEDGRIVFDVELDAARRAGLVISTKLLRLARFVRHQAATP